ncbi:MAG: maleylpyruvate isomerase family mycothiol-dependent enzyme [Actinomycetota bacterium]
MAPTDRPGADDGAIVDVAGIERAVGRVAEVARSVELSTPVPHLGRWKVRDVVAHLGGVHRWATRIVETRSMDGPGSRMSELDGVELCDWFDEGAAELVEALAGPAPSDHCPNFNPGSASTVAWWVRRQLHETTVHRWDVERAVGSCTPIEAPIAADGVDEFLDVFVRTRGEQTLTAPLTLTSIDPARSWSLTPSDRPGRVDIAPGRLADVAEEISGPADDLLLLVWGRLELAETALTVAGSPEVAASL